LHYIEQRIYAVWVAAMWPSASAGEPQGYGTCLNTGGGPPPDRRMSPGYASGDKEVANKTNPRSSERSRVRVVVVDFEGPSNDLHQLAQTLVHAVKPPEPVVLNVPSATPPSLTVRQNRDGPGLFDHLDAGQPDSTQQEAEPAQVVSALDGSRKKRKLRTPVPLDLDLNTGAKPFKNYIEEVAPKSDAKRYLAIAQWLKEHRGIAEIGADHVYTCYRFLSLSVPDDVLSVFRGLKQRAYVVAGSARGMFRINHIGENQLTQANNEE
jgi:hypothetical protein